MFFHRFSSRIGLVTGFHGLSAYKQVEHVFLNLFNLRHKLEWQRCHSRWLKIVMTRQLVHLLAHRNQGQHRRGLRCMMIARDAMGTCVTSSIRSAIRSHLLLMAD